MGINIIEYHTLPPHITICSTGLPEEEDIGESSLMVFYMPFLYMINAEINVVI